MQRIVLEGRCANCNRLLFERSVEDQATTHDLSVVCYSCIHTQIDPFIPRISIRPIIQAPID